ncbi:MAG: sugar transferase [Patescibacteria group bacterium]
MKRSRLLFTFLPLPIDWLMVWGAFLLAYWARAHQWFGVPEVTYMLPWGEYVGLTSLIATVWVVIFATTSIYNRQPSDKLGSLLYQIFAGVSISLALFIIVLFGLKETFFSRLIAAYAWGFSILLVFCGRLLLSAGQRILAKFGYQREHIVIIGHGTTADELADHCKKNLALVKIIDPTELLETENPGALINVEQTDQIIFTSDSGNHNGLELQLIEFCEQHGIRFKYVPSKVQLRSLNLFSEVIKGHPLLEIKPTALDGWGRIIKRVFDFLFAAIAIILLAPVMIIIAILIKLNSTGPALYIQNRPGQFGKEFNFYKFRSMYTHLSTGEQYGGREAENLLDQLRQHSNEATGPLFKMKNDPRVTKIGKWLRKTSLDELPQLFNVLDGDMSIVGPRPPLVNEYVQYSKEQNRRMLVKPGLTGLWQVSGRSDSVFDEYIKLDLYYIEHWSLWLDIQIILKTIWAVITHKGAY